MGKITILSLIWLGLASAQITKLPLLGNINDLDGEFAAALPAPQKYTLTPWTEDEISRGLPKDSAWAGSLYEPQSHFYCKGDLSVYNVTFPDVRIQFTLLWPAAPTEFARNTKLELSNESVCSVLNPGL
ncbi:hypothetical protein ACJ72_05177 [Emergomyces africanus]|uniref:Uncharacterized protein n=1 Tax=Emergomyces africanus TaxID=1955775 RepID=A0A1B7NUM9_9EURO|nr:hypothetical protein ACJ72_05177 [Emergomyces africanus]